MKKFCSCLIVLAFSFGAKSQVPRYFNYSVEQGLPSSETYNVMQDSKGFIWICTDRGAVRYNGYEFRVFTTNDGLPSNTVFSTIEDEEGRIWFLSFDKRLSYFHNNRIYLYEYNHLLEKLVQTTPDPRILHYTKKDGLYVCFDRNGLLHIDAQGKVEEIVPRLSPDRKKIFMAMINGRGYAGSVFHAEIPDTMFLETVEDHQRHKYLYPYKDLGWSEHIIFARRKNGTLLAATHEKIFEWKPGQPPRAHSFDFILNRLIEDRDSCLWVCTYRQGARKLYPGSSNLEHYQFTLLKDKSVTGVLHDAEGGYWFSTHEDGVYYFPQFNFLYAETPMLEKKVGVNSITGDGRNDVYVSYENGIIEKLTGTRYTGVFDMNKGTPQITNTYKIWYDQTSGDLLCGCDKGMKVFRKDGSLKKKHRLMARVCNGMNSDDFYFAGEWLYRFKNDSAVALTKGNETMRIEDICMDEQGRVWMASISGAYVYDPHKGTCKTFDFLKNTRVKEVKHLGHGKMVYATLGKGLVIASTDRIICIDEKNGLASNFVNSVTSDNDTLWTATTKGISRLILLNDTVLVNNFDQYNGLPTNEVKAIYQQGRYVWLGTKQGLCWFDATRIRIDTVGPRIYLDEVRVNDKTIKGRHSFAAGENNISFNFFAINYKKRGNIGYRYRLLGYDTNWKHTINRNVTYLSLPSGEYVFEVQARNQDGYWSAAAASFPFVVAKPVYLTWWFITISFLLVISVIYLLVRRRITAIRRNNQVVLLMNEYKSMALASQINPHFIFNSLNSIQAFIIHEDRVSAAKYLSSFARLMRKSLEHSRIDFVSLHDEMELLNMYLSLEQLRFKNKFSYRFEVDGAIDLNETGVPAMIFQPFIENSIRHGLIPREEKDGMIVIRIKMEKNRLRCEVEDNGVGRKTHRQKTAEDTVQRSHGIDITSERIKVYSRNEGVDFFFAIEDHPNHIVGTVGTKVIFYLPFRKLKNEKRSFT